MSRPRRTLSIATVLALACLVFAATAAAESRLFWTNNGSGTIGSASRAGGEVSQTTVATGGEPFGIAADATHVYWSDEGTDKVGRAKLDGSEVDASLIPAAGEVPEGMAVDGEHVYWANLLGQAIGRANLDGSDPEPNFIQLTAASFPEGVAVEGGHIYWTAAGHGGQIGRANLAGGEIDEELLAGLGGAISALAADPTYLYWTTNVGVGRAKLDGSEVDTGLVTGQNNVGGVAVDNEHVFWASFTTNQIGRAKLDGGEVEPAFITGAVNPDTLTVSLNATTTATAASAASVTAGESVHATATLAGGEATSGTISFALHGPGDETCAAAPLQTFAVTVAGNGTYSSPAVAPSAAGTYHWVARYGGNAINAPSASACAAGAFAVKAPAGNSTPPQTKATTTVNPGGPLLLLKVTRDKTRGIGHISFKVPGPGKLTVSGSGVKTRSVTATKSGHLVATLIPKGAYAAHLRSHHRGFTAVKVSFKPNHGPAIVFTRNVRLVSRAAGGG